VLGKFDRGLGWKDMHDLPQETLTRRRFEECVMCRVGSPNFLSLFNVIAPRYRIRSGNFLQIDFHCTNYGVHEPLNDAIRHYIEVLVCLIFICQGINEILQSFQQVNIHTK
jgi:hypothetical protein